MPIHTQKRRLTRTNLVRQTGATLIEALVAILILSFGLMGMAGLQANALAFQKSSWLTHRVADLSNDIGERIRSNPTADSRGAYRYIQAYSASPVAIPASNGCRQSAAGTCTPIQVANDDLGEWVLKAQAALPSGAVMLDGDANDGYIVTAMYSDKGLTDATGAPISSPVCSAGLTGTAARNCCPAAASAPPGIRCFRSTILTRRL